MVVNEIKRTTLADINQELFDMAFGKDAVTNEAEMRDRLAKEISSYFDGQAEHLLEHGMTDAIVAKHNITLPDAFLQRWLKDRYADKFNDDNMEEAFKPEANYLKNHLFEEKVLVSNNIKVEEEDIRAAAVEYTKSMFGMYGMSNQLNDELIDSLVEPNLKKDDYRSKMINSAVKKKVNDYIKSVITIENKEISQEEFLKIVEEHNHQHHNHSHEE
jgi:trigger factor